MIKKVLVTGAAGFIGSHLAQQLAARGDHVVGLDNFNDYYPVELKEGRNAILAEQGIMVHHGDICDRDFLDMLFAEHKFTHVAHLAAQAGVRYSITHPHKYVKSNLEGFTNILEVCRHNPPVKLIYASSSSVYGLNKTIPFTETDPVEQPVSLYGATKKANELMAFSYHNLYQLPVTGLRFFTVYGPWGRPDMAYFSFTKNIIEGKPIQVFNHGKMHRDFTYIDDIIDGTVAAIDLGAECEVFNLGNHRTEELGNLIRIIEEGLGKKAVIEYVGMQKGDVTATYANIDHAKELLGFSPKVSIEEGIPRFLEWYKEFQVLSKVGSASTN
jgi:UDP-glucuronate 4-epimerase